jgi:hypothetical protein
MYQLRTRSVARAWLKRQRGGGSASFAAAHTRTPFLRALYICMVALGQFKGALLHGLGKLGAQHVQGAVGRQQQPVEARVCLWQVGPPLCVRERRLVGHTAPWVAFVATMSTQLPTTLVTVTSPDITCTLQARLPQCKV